MGKGDDKKALTARIGGESIRSNTQNKAGISETDERIKGSLIPRADQDYGEIRGGYSDLASNPGQVLNYWNQAGSTASGSGSSGGGGGEGSPTGFNMPDYIKTFDEMRGGTGGFDPTRLSNVNSASAGLRDFAGRGGVDAADLEGINRDLYREFEKTGGYTASDIANIRARSNSNIPGFYANLQNDLKLQQRRGNSTGPGWSSTSAKMARESAQASAANVRDTEIGIGDSVRTGRMNAADRIAANAQQLASLKSSNTLAGYKGSADVDLSAQDLINKTRLGAASGLSQDALGRESIAASRGAAGAAIEAANQRYLTGLQADTRMGGLGGMLNLYNSTPGELYNNQRLLYDYRKEGDQANLGLINAQIGNKGAPTDWGSIIGAGISGGVSIYEGMNNNKPSTNMPGGYGY